MVAAVLRELSDVRVGGRDRRPQAPAPASARHAATGRPPAAVCRVGASGADDGASLLRSPPATLALVHAPLAGGGHLRLPRGHRGRRHHPDQPGAAGPRAAAGRAAASAPPAAAASRAAAATGRAETGSRPSARCTSSARRRCVPGRVAPPAPRADRALRVLRQLGRHQLHLAQAERRAHRRARARMAAPGRRDRAASSRTTRRAGRWCSTSSRSGGPICASCRSSTTSTPTRSTGSRRASGRCWPTRRRARRRSPAITAFVGQHGFEGINVDFEAIPESAPAAARLVHVRAEGRSSSRAAGPCRSPCRSTTARSTTRRSAPAPIA